MFRTRDIYIVRFIHYAEAPRRTVCSDEFVDLRGPTVTGVPHEDPYHLRPCQHCGKLFPVGELYENSCRSCLQGSSTRLSQATELYRCEGCGIRFSINMMRDGMCHNCRANSSTASARPLRDRFAASAPRSPLEKAYHVLGCDRKSSDEQVRACRRALVKDCHSDLLPCGVTGDRVREADARFREIQEAYETIMSARRK